MSNNVVGFLGTSPHPEASTAAPCRGHLSCIQKMVNYKGFRSSETWDKDPYLVFYYTIDISWSFIVVFTKCSFILVLKNSVFTRA